MTPFMQMRERIRNFISTHEVACTRVGHGFLMLLGLVVIMRVFPFASGLNRPWIVVALTILGVFMPLNTEAAVLLVVLLLNLFALSNEVALVACALFFVSYLCCMVYRARRLYQVVGLALARQIALPYLIPMESALLGSGNEVVTVLCGAVMSFFLQEVYINAGVLMEGEGQMAIMDFLQEKLVSNQMFYVYLLAMVALFLVVYFVRTRNIDHAWTVAVVAGVSVEFLIMLSGVLLIGTNNLPGLLGSNMATLLFGLAIVYIYQDLDYSRIERVQFEDDEYYYHVTAVPKIRLTEEKKEVRHIHRSRNRGRVRKERDK